MRLTIFLIGLCWTTLCRANVELAPLFQDHAVLQRGKPIPIWGRANPGERVTVALGEQTLQTKAAQDGRWLIYLEALEANSTPVDLLVRGDNEVLVKDILVGEVWLCSGQSNMEWPVRMVDRAPEEMASANFPLIRHFKVEKTVSTSPADTVAGDWRVCKPDTVGDFTAVGYFFARDIFRKLQVPVGIVNSTWGGTNIESWMSGAALESDPRFTVVNDRWTKTLNNYPQLKSQFDADLAVFTAEEVAAKAAGKPLNRRKPNPPMGVGHPNTPTALFNGMISPLLPYALRGFLWYQGESNASRANEYQPLFASMITHWRAHFGQGDLPFYWVQLASYATDDPNSGTYPLLREAQDQTLQLPQTGQAIAMDIGNPVDIHPRNKQDVGRRLALIAKARIYDIHVDYSGPVFAKAEREGGALRVHFNHAGTGLIARDKPLQSFEVAGEDRRFFAAKAAIDGDTLLVSSPQVKDPVAVRYAWRNAAEANLYNGAGLPATPFRSHPW